MPYIGVSPQFGVRRKHTYTATAGQTSFSGAGSEGATLSYTDSNFVDVYQNGVKLGDADYTSTSGTAIVLAQGASVSDLVEIIVFDAFSAADTVSKADGGTFDGNVTMGGTLGVTGALSAKGGAVFNEDSASVDFRIESNDDANMFFLDGSANAIGIRTSTDYGGQLNVETTGQAYNVVLACTDDDANNGPLLDFYRNSSSPADSDLLGEISFRGRNDNSQDVNYGHISGKIIDASDGTEDGMLDISTIKNGTKVSRIKITDDGTVINEDSKDINFRVESDGNAHMLFVDGGNDAVAIGNNNPADFGANTDNLVIGTTSGENGMTIVSGTGNGGRIQFADNTSDPFRGAFEYDHSSDKLIFYAAGSNRVSINSGGRIQTFNCTNSNGSINLVGEGGLSGRAASFQHTTNGSEVGYIGTTSTNTVYNTASDYRLKENVSYDFDATTRLKELKPCRFNFKIDTDKTVDGFLAHEVSHDADGNPLVPEAISGAKDATEDIKNIVLNADGTILATDVSKDKWTEGKANETYASDTTWIASKTVPNYQGIDQSKLVPLLVKSLQEAIAEIDTLKTKVAALESK